VKNVLVILKVPQTNLKHEMCKSWPKCIWKKAVDLARNVSQCEDYVLGLKMADHSPLDYERLGHFLEELKGMALKVKRNLNPLVRAGVLKHQRAFRQWEILLTCVKTTRESIKLHWSEQANSQTRSAMRPDA
jgi:hypothetical protein